MSTELDGTTMSDDYLRVYTLADRELALLKHFREHDCPMRHHGVINRSVSLCFTRTEIGTAIEVSCHCGLSENITDYSVW